MKPVLLFNAARCIISSQNLINVLFLQLKHEELRVVYMQSKNSLYFLTHSLELNRSIVFSFAKFPQQLN